MVGLIVASLITGRLMVRMGRYRYLGTVGAALLVIGLYLLSQVTVGTPEIEVVRDLVLVGLGVGVGMPLYLNATQSAVDQRYLGVVSSQIQFWRNIGSTVGVAILGAVLSHELTQKIVAAIPPQFAGAIPANGNAQAIFDPAVMQRIPPPVLVAIRSALASSLHDLFLIAAGVAALAVVLSLFLQEVPIRGRTAPALRPAAEAGPARRQRIDELLQVVELADRANSLVRTFSGGMKRRLEIARGVLHHPQVLFLDEPTLGLDPQTRKHIWDYLNELRRREGVTLFMTTHYMDEAEFCDRIAIIDRGQIVALGTPVELKGRIGGDVITVSVGDVPAAAQEIQTRFGIAPLAANGTLRIEVPDGASFLPRLVRELPMRIDSVSLSRPSLDDVFLKLTGHAIRAEGASDKEMMRNMGRMWRGGRR